MYDNLTVKSMPFTPSAPAQMPNPHQQSGQPAPGTPGGSYPRPPAPAPVPRNPAAPLDSGNLQQQLESYKAKVDNEGNPIAQPNPNALKQSVVPKYEEFANSAQKLASTIQMDETQVQAALSGDPAAFQQVIQNAMQQALQQSMHMSANFASSYAYDQAGKATAAASANIADSASERTAIESAMSIIPTLDNEIGAEMIQHRVKALRAQYPTAPAELLGQYAASQIQALQPGQSDQVDQSTDWSTQF